MNIEKLYNKILLNSRNSNIYKNHIIDDLNNKILVFLILLSKTFNNMSKNNNFYQVFFDYIFNRIEADLREIGYGDMSVNKKMKVIVTKFYSILLDFKNFTDKSNNHKTDILLKYFSDIKQKDQFIEFLDTYFAIDNVDHDDI